MVSRRARPRPRAFGGCTTVRGAAPMCPSREVHDGAASNVVGVKLSPVEDVLAGVPDLPELPHALSAAAAGDVRAGEGQGAAVRRGHGAQELAVGDADADGPRAWV